MNRPVLGLAGKLGIAAVVLILLTTVSLAIGLTVKHHQRQSDAFRSFGQGLARAMAAHMQTGLFAADVAEIERIARGAMSFPDVAGVAVYDASGRFLARHGTTGLEKGPQWLSTSAQLLSSTSLEGLGTMLPGTRLVGFTASVMPAAGPAFSATETSLTEQEPLGHVVVSLSTASLNQQLRQSLQASLGMAAFMGMAGMAGMVIATRRILQPLQEVIAAAGELVAGHLERRVDVRLRDEIGVLAQALNGMGAQLREARDMLEQRVAERTRQLEDASAEAYRLAKHDALTGLPNRVLLRERLERAIDSGKRDRSVAVFFVDVDHFKAVNDSLGHDSGDLVLKAIAQRLGALVGQDGFSARLGGDEFVVVHEALPRDKAVAMAQALAKRIVEAVCQPIAVPGQELRMGASVGVALFPGDAADAASLLRAADTAMYAAKSNGRMGVKLFDPDMEVPARERLHLEAELRRALVNDEFEVWYQPQWSIDGHHLIGAEALLRWRSPQRGLVSPAIFIPVAEAGSLIRDIGAWVLEQAVCDAQAWNAIASESVRVTVNVSSCQLSHPGMVEMVTNVLAVYRLPPGLLELEFTESSIVDCANQVQRVLLELKASQVQLSIDDFGTGTSSFADLIRLPVNTLKIARSSVAGLPEVSSDRTVIQAICAMAHKVDLKVTAKGVETAEQLRILQHLGCDMAQGHLLGKPVPEAEFRQILMAKRASERPSASANQHRT